MTTLQAQPTLADYQKYIADMCRERGWDRPTLEKMLFLTEEVGEVAKAVRKEHAIASEKPANTDHLAEELVDVFNFLVDIANDFDIDLETAFRAKWQKTVTRSWPGSPAPK